MPARVLLFTLVLTTPLMAKAGDLVELLQTRKCPDCQLTDVDLVHSNLRDADLQGAQLQRANQQRIAANDPSVPNNTPSACY